MNVYGFRQVIKIYQHETGCSHQQPKNKQNTTKFVEHHDSKQRPSPVHASCFICCKRVVAGDRGNRARLMGLGAKRERAHRGRSASRSSISSGCPEFIALCLTYLHQDSRMKLRYGGRQSKKSRLYYFEL